MLISNLIGTISAKRSHAHSTIECTYLLNCIATDFLSCSKYSKWLCLGGSYLNTIFKLLLFKWYSGIHYDRKLHFIVLDNVDFFISAEHCFLIKMTKTPKHQDFKLVSRYFLLTHNFITILYSYVATRWYTATNQRIFL